MEGQKGRSTFEGVFVLPEASQILITFSGDSLIAENSHPHLLGALAVNRAPQQGRAIWDFALFQFCDVYQTDVCAAVGLASTQAWMVGLCLSPGLWSPNAIDHLATG